MIARTVNTITIKFLWVTIFSVILMTFHPLPYEQPLKASFTIIYHLFQSTIQKQATLRFYYYSFVNSKGTVIDRVVTPNIHSIQNLPTFTSHHFLKNNMSDKNNDG